MSGLAGDPESVSSSGEFASSQFRPTGSNSPSVVDSSHSATVQSHHRKRDSRRWTSRRHGAAAADDDAPSSNEASPAAPSVQIRPASAALGPSSPRRAEQGVVSPRGRLQRSLEVQGPPDGRGGLSSPQTRPLRSATSQSSDQADGFEPLPQIGHGVWRNGDGDSDLSDIPPPALYSRVIYSQTVQCTCYRVTVDNSKRVAGIFAMLCVVESLLAAVQRHYTGIIAGLIGSAVSWYLISAIHSAEISRWRLFRVLSWLAIPLGVYTACLIGVRCASGVFLDNVPTTVFPEACAPNTGCARVALTGSQGVGDIQPPLFAADPTALYTALHDVYREQYQTFRVSPKDQGPSYMQAVWLSVAWGFPDDVFARLSCNNSLTLVELQSQQRLGTSDFGANSMHIQVILKGLRKAEASLVPVPCVIEQDLVI